MSMTFKDGVLQEVLCDVDEMTAGSAVICADEIEEFNSFLSIDYGVLDKLKEKGAPIVGLVDLRFDPRYTVTRSEDRRDCTIKFSWHPTVRNTNVN